jgi:hypothetical protein
MNAYERKDNVAQMADAGYRIETSKDGIFTEPERIDMAEIERFWEK